MFDISVSAGRILALYESAMRPTRGLKVAGEDSGRVAAAK
jgi:hypothetical protein